MIVLEFKIFETKKKLFHSFQKITPLKELILKSLRERFDFLTLANSCGIGDDETLLRFQLQFNGICTDQKNGAALMREINFMLTDRGIKHFFQVNLMVVDEENDIELSNESIIRTTCINDKILSDYNVNEDLVPAEFLCSISKVIMDDPVYIKGGSDRYDFNSLREWYTAKDRLWDPIRNIYIEPSDIIHDGKLKTEISQFVGKAIEQALLLEKNENINLDDEQKSNRLIDLITKYELNVVSESTKETALRRAAAKGNSEDLAFLISIGVNINAQDSNPNNSKTALHWAVLNKQEQCIKLLLQHHAKIDIPDAKKYTAEYYALISDNSNIREIFKQNMPDLSEVANELASLKM